VAEDEWLRPSRSLVCVPIVYKEDILGVMCATDKRPSDTFTSSDVRLLGTVASQIAPAIENARLYRKLEDSSYATVRALVAGLEAKDPYLHGHALRVTSYALAIGAALGMQKRQLMTLERAGQLHDIGKLGISDVILNKPGRLTPSEFEAVKMHPVYGEDIIKHLDFLSDVRPVIRHHHERIDGAGYPDGKKGEEIELLARILSVADAFDAMTSPRPYRPAKDVSEAQKEITSLRAKQFDSAVADAFCGAVVSKS
jgi:HD-GYP domain-containing protein (c-di-GMP phosphodiesterase class II)